tara:strand:+ start:400 stop:768 length:369 start_codon:yes stop_codon:yes gene_type:complete
LYYLFLVASGGAAGALLRYTLSSITKSFFTYNFYSTLSINIIGSFFIGYLISIGYMKNISLEFVKYFLVIGLLGSFTTFSTFSYEVVDLLNSKKIYLSLLYIILSVVLSVSAAYIGILISKF